MLSTWCTSGEPSRAEPMKWMPIVTDTELAAYSSAAAGSPLLPTASAIIAASGRSAGAGDLAAAAPLSGDAWASGLDPTIAEAVASIRRQMLQLQLQQQQQHQQLLPHRTKVIPGISYTAPDKQSISLTTTLAHHTVIPAAAATDPLAAKHSAKSLTGPGHGFYVCPGSLRASVCALQEHKLTIRQRDTGTGQLPILSEVHQGSNAAMHSVDHAGPRPALQTSSIKQLLLLEHGTPYPASTANVQPPSARSTTCDAPRALPAAVLAAMASPRQQQALLAASARQPQQVTAQQAQAAQQQQQQCAEGAEVSSVQGSSWGWGSKIRQFFSSSGSGSAATGGGVPILHHQQQQQHQQPPNAPDAAAAAATRPQQQQSQQLAATSEDSTGAAATLQEQHKQQAEHDIEQQGRQDVLADPLPQEQEFCTLVANTSYSAALMPPAGMSDSESQNPEAGCTCQQPPTSRGQLPRAEEGSSS